MQFDNSNRVRAQMKQNVSLAIKLALIVAAACAGVTKLLLDLPVRLEEVVHVKAEGEGDHELNSW